MAEDVDYSLGENPSLLGICTWNYYLCLPIPGGWVLLIFNRLVILLTVISMFPEVQVLNESTRCSKLDKQRRWS